MDAPQFDPALVAQAKLAAASFCGGMVRLIFKPAASIIKTGWLLFGCVTCGFYGSTPFMHWWNIDHPDAATVGAVGALLGFVGLSFAEGLLKAMDNLDLKAWLARWATKGTGE